MNVTVRGQVRTPGEKAPSVPMAERDRHVTGDCAVQKDMVVPGLGRLGPSRASLCVVATVPALHSERLCWAPSSQLRRWGTQYTSHRKPGPRPSGPRSCLCLNKLPRPSRPPRPRDPANRSHLLPPPQLGGAGSPVTQLAFASSDVPVTQETSGSPCLLPTPVITFPRPCPRT